MKASESVQMNVRVEPKLFAAVRTQARRENLTVTALVAAALTNYVSREKGTA
jgi:predicted HicB family RNase H-like nuclease